MSGYLSSDAKPHDATGVVSVATALKRIDERK